MLELSGWDINYGGAVRCGSYCRKQEKVIVLDQSLKNNPELLIQVLAHETGHAMYIADPYVPFNGLTKKQYVDANVEGLLKDEGEATITNIEIRNEVLVNGGQDIGIAGRHSEKYEAIYNETYLKNGDRNSARKQIGEVFAEGERLSTDPSKNYKEYYAKHYEDHYDKHNKGHD